MKKILMITMIGAGLTFSFNAQAQSQGDMRGQFGGILGTEAALDGAGFGFNIGLEYFFSDIISAAPSYDYFFKDEVSLFSFQTSSVNIDGRYYFSEEFYGLAGLAFVTVKSDIDFLGTPISANFNETGVNLGAGYNLAMGESTLLNFQAKYSSPFRGLVIQAGVAFSF